MRTTVSHLRQILGEYPSDAVLSYLSSPRGEKGPSGCQVTVRELRAIADFDDLNVWMCLNPMRRVGSGGRGGEADVCEVRALFCDLDIADGKMPDEAACRETIDILSRILGQPPAYVTFTGHGFQPVWRVIPDTDVESWRLVKPRWASLVRTVARSVGGGSVDGAFDLARVLRIPGSTNWKFPDEPVQTRIEWLDGAPLSRSQVEHALDAYGFRQDEKTRKPTARAKTPLSTCGYVRAMIAGWSNDDPPARHPWVVAQAVRLEAAVVLGCVSSADEAAARDILARRLRELTLGEIREDSDSEMARVWRFAHVRVSQMDESRLRSELGDHQHTRADEPKAVLDVTNPAAAGAAAREVIGSGPTSSLFARGGQVVVVAESSRPESERTSMTKRSTSALQLSAVNGIRLAAELDLKYSIVKRGKDGKEVPAIFPREMATRLASAPEHLPRLRPLTGVTRTPFVRPDWSICSQPGYDEVTGVLYAPSGVGIEIPGQVGRNDVEEAVALLLLMLHDFPWKSPNDRANFLAALIWPLIVHTHSDVSPALIINAHQPGSGKTLLAEVLRTLFDGSLRPDWPTGKEEQEKEVAAILSSTTGAYAVFDNVRGRILSGVLEGVLTQRYSNVRRLGSNSESLPLVNDRTFVFTGNNVTIGGDLGRRVVWCSIDPGMPNPELRSEFAVSGPLITWVEDNRESVIRALMVLIAFWIQQGRPLQPSRSDSFASTIDVAQGVLTTVGIAGVVADPDTTPVAGASEDDEWREWYVALSAYFKDGHFRAAELFRLIDDASDGYLQGAKADIWRRAPSSILSALKSGRLTPRGLGIHLSNRVGRYHGDLSLQVIADQRNGHRYFLHSYSAGETQARAG